MMFSRYFLEKMTIEKSSNAVYLAGCRGTHGDTDDLWGFVNSRIIANFTDCSIIEGGLDIIDETFNG
jgi:hypothetical protein